MTDTLVIVLVTAACTALVGGAGAVAVRQARRVSLVLALVLAALVPFVAVVLAVGVNVGAMFISPHDADVARLVLGLSAVPAVLIALVLGRALVADVRVVGRRARTLVATDAPDAAGAAGADGPLTAELGAVAAELAVTRDRLLASQARERGLEASRRQIVAFVTHDLRSPLAGIRATVDGLRDGVLPAAPATYEAVSGAVERMSRLLDDLTEISRPDDDGPAPRRPTRVRVAELLEHALAQARPAAVAHGVRLEAQVEPDLEVVGVPDDLARVLDNLVGNAVRSSGDGGLVRVAGRLVAGEARIAVADTCGGIAEDDVHHVFAPGWQGRDGTPTGRAGLGLAIVDRVVAEHGGRVEVGSTAQGCRFEVALPVDEPSSVGASPTDEVSVGEQ